MLYDTIRNPMARKTPPKVALDSTSKSLDTLETTQQRLNREMMERFQNSSPRVSHQTFAIASQAGKYLFLAIMLPPYICFFGLPRWFLIDLMPLFFSFTKGQSLRVGKFFQVLTKRISDMMKGILEQMLGDALRLFGRKSKSLAQQIYGGFQQVGKALVGGLQKIQQIAVALDHIVRTGMRKFMDRAKNVIQGIVENREKALNIVKALLNPIEQIERFLIHPVSEWTVQKVNAVLAVAKSIRTYSLGLAAKAKGIAKKLVDNSRISDATAFISSILRQSIQNTVQQMLNWVQTTVDVAVKWPAETVGKIVKAVAKAVETARNKMRSAASTVSDAAAQAIQMVSQIAVQFTGWAWWLPAPFFKQQWTRFKQSGENAFNFFKSLGFAAGTGAKAMAGNAKALLNHIFAETGKLAKLLRKFFLLLLVHLLKLPKYLMQSVRWFGSCLLYTIQRLILGTRLTIACVWALSRHSLMLMQEASYELVLCIKSFASNF